MLLSQTTCDRCDFPLPPHKNRCPSCRAWQNVRGTFKGSAGDGTIGLDDAEVKDLARTKTGPWDPCFGGGIVTASTVLLGGAPGAGKSSLSLQLGCAFAEARKARGLPFEVLYVASEELAGQIRDRAKRFRLDYQDVFRLVALKDGFVGDLGDVILLRRPALIVVDSISGMVSELEAPKFCSRLADYAVEIQAPVLILDHVTKEDEFAGLMKLQHVVDATLSVFPYVKGAEGRIMKTIKNRFGPNTEVCLTMTEIGLRACGGCIFCTEPEEDDAQ